MSQVKIHFFVGPKPSFSFDRFFKPTKQQSEIISKFINLGYAPVINSESSYNPNSIEGLVWCIDEDHIQLSKNYTGGKVFMFIYYNEKSTPQQLLASKIYFEDILQLTGTRKERFTRSMSRLLEDKKSFEPIKPQPYLNGSGRQSYTELPNGRQLIARIQGGEFEEKVNERLLQAAESLSLLSAR